MTNQRRVCCVPSADPDKVKTTDLALVNVIASSDSSRPKITESLPGLDSVRPKLLQSGSAKLVAFFHDFKPISKFWMAELLNIWLIY